MEARPRDEAGMRLSDSTTGTAIPFNTRVTEATPPVLRPGTRLVRRRVGAHVPARFLELVDSNVFVILVVAVAGTVRIGLLGLGIGSDTWYDLLGGRIVGSSWLPHHDSLTVLGHGRQWVDQQWLAHLLLYRLWLAGGWSLALVIVVACYLGGFSLAATAARRAGASGRSTAVVTLCCLVLAMGETGFRAQTLAYVLFALLLFLLLDDEARPSRRVFVTLPLLAVWANVHGSVLLGAGLVALYGLTTAIANLRARRKPSTWLPRSLVLAMGPWLCTLASPYGAALPGYYERLLHNPTLSRVVSEWQPATVKSEPIFFVVLVAALWLAFSRVGSGTLFARLALLLTAVGGLLAVRHIVWFALAATALLPRSLDEVWPAGEAPRRKSLNLTIAGVSIVALAAATAAFASHDRQWFEREYPMRAGDAAAAAAAGNRSIRVFADERYADWLLFEHPSLAGRLAYDVRFEVLSPRDLATVAAFRMEQGSNWLRATHEYRILVLDPTSDQGAINLLRRRGDTRVLYRGRSVVVLERARSGA
jgi:hypothetical protein